jgi:hypothetical protein
MDPERDEQRHCYRMCWAAFALLSVGHVLFCLDMTLELLAFPLIPGNRDLQGLLSSPWWDYLVGAPITWISLVGSYLLWGRWLEPTWQRRAGLLVVMNLADAILWTLHHGDDLGLRLGGIGHEWFRYALARALGWAEFALMASLASDVAAHLGREDAAEAGTMARSCTFVGAALWGLWFFVTTDWHRGWPLARGPMRFLELWLLMFGWQILLTVVLYQVTALCISACRLCGQELTAMAREDEQHDLLRSPSEVFADADDRWR